MDPIEPLITLIAGDDVLQYFAVHGSDVLPEEVGWAMRIEGPRPVEPHAVSAPEIVEDLDDAGEAVASLLVFVQSGTNDMLAALRAHPDSTTPGAPAAIRLAELEQELAAIPPLEEDDG